jgi:hypothetical protein
MVSQTGAGVLQVPLFVGVRRITGMTRRVFFSYFTKLLLAALNFS